MELIEREVFLAALDRLYQRMLDGEGHTVFISGEAGIGKTSLVKQFARCLEKSKNVFTGTCDPLFTPRPLAPLYDVALQLEGDAWLQQHDVFPRADLFTRFFQALKNRKERTVIIFEDVHWADEASFDFIRFLARRIHSLPCLFILTHREEECKSVQLLQTIMGQLAPGSFSRMPLPPFSKEAVEKLALKKGFDAEEVYSITGGNPFYVNEILAYYSSGVPATIKDSILAIHHQIDPGLRELWETLSILPTGLEIKYLAQFEPMYLSVLENCFSSGIIVFKNNTVSFKHELYRRTIEETLSPLKRLALHKKILDLFLLQFESAGEIERIVHHAKNANASETVVRYAPRAARQALAAGAHIEAAKLYLTALENYQGNDPNLLVEFYESYAYECYLTNQIREAIIYTGKAHSVWKEKGNNLQTGNCLRFLSRLWWFEGDRLKAEQYGKEAISVLENEASSSVKAMAFSNMSQLKMLDDHREECLYWGEQAMAMAKELGDEEILSHALNNMGAALITDPSTREKGRAMLEQSLAIALKNDLHEHAARAYTNLGCGGTRCRDYAKALIALQEGIRYSEEKNLDSWSTYMSSWLARLEFETGNWDKAYQVAENLIHNESNPPIVKISALTIAAQVRMRRGEEPVLPYLLEAKTKAANTREAQRIQPVFTALLEYEWLSGKSIMEAEELNAAAEIIRQTGTLPEKSEFAFWLQKAGRKKLPGIAPQEGYRFQTPAEIKKAQAFWKQTGCPYEQALFLFEGTEADKKTALQLVQELGAQAVFHKMKQLMRNAGIRNIPRGMRNSTQSNPAHLTERELSILQLLPMGLQNREIADKLFISPKTVDHHISSILFKLDVNCRSKAAREAERLGIIK